MHQYYKPAGNRNVGDCMPFFHDGTFRLFYLLDEDHHQALGGLGGHQWAQAATTDLLCWEEQPMAIPITDEREGSICTGSVLFHNGAYHAFYATRMRDRTQHLGLATSEDGVTFRKTDPNPFASPPPGYHPHHYRDPFAFRDAAGRFHLLVTALLADWPVPERAGCLAHLVSDDLCSWQVQEPFLVPGLRNVPECPDYFFWRGWYYLVFSNDGVARYRMSRAPFGPWRRPPVDALDGPASRVMKTARFGDDRRIGVAWIGTRADGVDSGPFQFGGNALFRELVQHADGTLGCTFPAEMVPTGRAWELGEFRALLGEVAVQSRAVRLGPGAGLALARFAEVPRNLRLSMRVVPRPGAASFGLRLCAGPSFESGYPLEFRPHENCVRLGGQTLTDVSGLDGAFGLEVILKEDIADVCIDRRRTLVDRWPERRGGAIWFYALDAGVGFADMRIEELS